MTIRIRVHQDWSAPAGTGQRAAAEAVPIMRRLGRAITTTARRRVNVRSGRLRSTIGHRVTPAGPVVRLDVFATARHARYVHDGTRPHVITPRRAAVLRFEVGGRTVFARRVQHPGYRGNPFLSSAVRDELARAKLT
ncbi:hypothetical protein NDR87_31435 [Nocardia sp. CDC159]|uniref:HK97 gp10 family phage protein n=1 Tax=Nocardia pulmonis TaxID=2951408 RepID=A0A9X2IZC9_9NOCA|nr:MULTISPECIES: hypothetical protein [Nocardia]MCM6777937.1 hypothetical protein [Nocardia pulmonis]MCM6790892.1 hypothetical protein [Nocardia sp. CDC159]